MTISEAITAVLHASHHGDHHFRNFLKGDDPEVVAMRKALVMLADAVRESEDTILTKDSLGHVMFLLDGIFDHTKHGTEDIPGWRMRFIRDSAKTIEEIISP